MFTIPEVREELLKRRQHFQNLVDEAAAILLTLTNPEKNAPHKWNVRIEINHERVQAVDIMVESLRPWTDVGQLVLPITRIPYPDGSHMTNSYSVPESYRFISTGFRREDANSYYYHRRTVIYGIEYIVVQGPYSYATVADYVPKIVHKSSVRFISKTPVSDCKVNTFKW